MKLDFCFCLNEIYLGQGRLEVMVLDMLLVLRQLDKMREHHSQVLNDSHENGSLFGMKSNEIISVWLNQIQTLNAKCKC